MAKVKEHTIGEVRYFQYTVEFPDHDRWVDYCPFVGNLRDILPTTRWKNDPIKCRDLLIKGETTWKDGNGVQHHVRVVDTEGERNWGVKRNPK
jgi:hypothetical protein